MKQICQPHWKRSRHRRHHHYHHQVLLQVLLVGTSLLFTSLLLFTSVVVVTAEVVADVTPEEEAEEKHQLQVKDDNDDFLLLLREWYSKQQQQTLIPPGTKRQALYQYSLDLHYQDILQDTVLFMEDQQQKQQQQQQQQRHDNNDDDDDDNDSSMPPPHQQQQQPQYYSIIQQSIRNVYAIFRKSITSRKQRNQHQQSQQQHGQQSQQSSSTTTTTTPINNNNNNINNIESRPFVDDDSITSSTRVGPTSSFGDRYTSLQASYPPFPISLKESNRALLQEMFINSYDAYMYNAYFPSNAQAGEVKPLSCKPSKFDLIQLPALTIVDALDTILIMNNVTEFARAVERLRILHTTNNMNSKSGGGIFDVDINVSLFETNIRMLGGLLSGHQMAMAFIAHHNNHIDTKNKKKRALAKPVLLKNVFMSDGITVRNGRLEQEELQQQWQTATCSAATTSSSSTVTKDTVIPLDHHDGSSSASSSSSTNRFVDVCDNGYLSLQDCAVMTSTAADPATAAVAGTKNSRHNTTTTTRRQLRRTLLLSRQQTQQNNTDDDNDDLTPYWHYDGFLLDLAIDLGNRFLPAFNTKTGIPYGTVNLQHGVPRGETTIASLAGAGSLSLEMELLSRLSGNVEYGRLAKRATRALWQRQYSTTGLVGKHIDVQSGMWTESLSGIGSNSDSFYEYLVKHYMLFGMNDGNNNNNNNNNGDNKNSNGGGGGDKDFWVMLLTAYTGIYKNLRVGEWYTDGDMHTQQQLQQQQYSKIPGSNGGSPTRRAILESLMAFYPGMQILLGQIIPAARTLNSFFLVREYLGFLPERFHFGHWRKDGGMGGAGRHPLRPELLESCYFLHRTIQQEQHGSSSMSSSSSFSGWLWAADFALQKLERTTKAKCGYAGLNDVKPSTTGLVNSTDEQNRGNIDYMNEMPSFFLSETIKYLYLTFDDDNILHLDADNRQWIFTTEAHPIHHVPAAATVTTSSSSSSNSNQPNGNDNNNDKFSRDVSVLKKLLQSRIHRHHHHSSGANISSSRSRSIDSLRAASRKQQDRSLSQELWSEATTLSDFNGMTSATLDQLIGLRHKKANSNNDSHHGVFVDLDNDLESIVPHEQIEMDAWKDAANHRNVAHLGWRALGSGDGTFLRKACPNVHASDWLWMNALHGGSMDYADAYSSVTNDNFAQHVNGFVVLGASETLGFHGSGVYLGQFDTPGCSLVGDETVAAAAAKSAARNSAQQSSTSSSSSQQQETPDSTELKTDLGTFQVAASPGGSGFSVHLKESGQSIHATILTDGDDFSESFVLVHSSTPKTGVSEADSPTRVTASSSGSGEFSSWWSQFLSKSIPDFTVDRSDRTTDEQVRIADFENNVFGCEVEIVAKKEQESEAGDDSSVLLARAPCTPALFGPSKVSKLAQSGGIVIEASLYAPSEQDLYGCNPGPVESQRSSPPTEVSPPEFPWNGVNDKYRDDSSMCYAEEPSCPNRIIQFVHRGGCSFGTKVANQKNSLNADAVVVINSQEEELFVMSSGANDLGIPDDSLPVAVLVAGLDGEELLRAATNAIIADESGTRNNDSHIVARVSLTRQDADDFDATKTGDGKQHSFPMVQANPQLLRVFAQGGWGVQALRHAHDENTNWQVQLMRHELDASIQEKDYSFLYK